MKLVHVITGGTSSERPVSLRSGAAVAAALTTAGYRVELLDSEQVTLDAIVACDVVFPVIHGAGGEDGVLQATLETRHIPFVGTGSAASKICFDKWLYRQTITPTGLPMADAALVDTDSYRDNPLAAQAYVLKPLTGGSSIDTYVVRDPQQAPHDQIIETFKRYPTLLIEQLIVGNELTVGILVDQALPVIEIIPPQDGEFDYDNKYNGATQELCPPQHVSRTIQEQAQALALRAHKLVGCRDYSRTDIMHDTVTDQLYVLETNTIPGMTEQSLFPKMAKTAGMSMPELCDQLVRLALSR